MARRPSSMSVVVRASIDAALDGRLVATVEQVDTGERRAVQDLDELMAWIQVGANRRAALDEIAVDQPDGLPGRGQPSRDQPDPPEASERHSDG